MFVPTERKNPWASWRAFFYFLIAFVGVSIGVEYALDAWAPPQLRDPRFVPILAQSLGLFAAFLAEWPIVRRIEERHQAIQTFGGYVLIMWTICLVLFAARIKFQLT